MGSLPIDNIDHETVVIGAGFSGLYELHRLKKAGFKARLYEAGSGVGGIWYWDCYPGARVDTPVPTYQLTADETWKTWNWSQRFPDYAELRTYFTHLVEVWGLQDMITFNTRIGQMVWDDKTHHWDLYAKTTDGTQSTISTRSVVLCTGFGSKPYIPPFQGIDTFKGERLHTGLWPQGSIDLIGKRVAIIGTGASGVQIIQETAKVAKHLTVYQRTPNTALHMKNPKLDKAANDEWKGTYEDTKKMVLQTFAGFDYEFDPQKSTSVTPEARVELYKKLLTSGGLHFWLGTYSDVLFDQDANDEAYEYWRQSVLPRVKDPKNQEILAPKVPPHPFGTKRISLEKDYFEVFNQDNVNLVNLQTNNIDAFTEKGIRTADGTEEEFDIIVTATGFDSVTGGITSIDVRGTNPQESIKERWSKATYTLFGMMSSGFPNLYFMYGPQAPTAFATGPSSAECQGEWITTALDYMRKNNITKMDPEHAAEKEWRDHTLEMGDKGLFKQAKSWYYGDNIPGKPREALNYMAGLPLYREKIWESANNQYQGFALTT